jgi:hypothetical protein
MYLDVAWQYVLEGAGSGDELEYGAIGRGQRD